MQVHLDLEIDEGLLEVEVMVQAGYILTVTDLQKLIGILWPGIDPERIWIYRSMVFNGISLMHMDAPGANERSEEYRKREKR